MILLIQALILIGGTALIASGRAAQLGLSSKAKQVLRICGAIFLLSGISGVAYLMF